MSKKIQLILMIVLSFSARSQSFNYSIITNVNQRGQVGHETCWAASLEMLRSCYLNNPYSSNFQLDLINSAFRTSFNYSNFDSLYTNQVSDIKIDSLKQLLYNDFQPSFQLYSNLSKNPSFPSWDSLKKSLNQNNSPIIFWRRFRTDGDNFLHVSLIFGFIETIHNGHVVRELLVYDPYNKVASAKGHRLSINYDQFIGEFNQTSRNLLEWAFIFDFVPKRSSHSLSPAHIEKISSSDTAGIFNKYSKKKKFFQSKKKAQKKMAQELAGPYFSDNHPSNYFNFWNVKHSTKAGVKDAITVDYINIDDLKSINYRNFKTYKPRNETEQFNLVENYNDSCFVLVSSKLPGQTKNVFLQNRIEPIDQSIVQVIGNMVANNSGSNNTQISLNHQIQPQYSYSAGIPDLNFESINFNQLLNTFRGLRKNKLQGLKVNLDHAFYHKSYSNKPDFLLFNLLDKNRQPGFLLVDLFNQISVLPPSNRLLGIGQIIGDFDYRVYKLNESELKALANSPLN